MSIQHVGYGILNITPKIQVNAFQYIKSLFPKNVLKESKDKTVQNFEKRDYLNEIETLRGAFALYRREGLLVHFKNKAKTDLNLCVLDYLILKEHLVNISYSLDFDMKDDIFHIITEHYLSSDYTFNI